jgi:GNAT superfamily N-acetyltransferase
LQLSSGKQGKNNIIDRSRPLILTEKATQSKINNNNPARTDRASIRPLKEEELDEAESIVRTAFGTFLHLPDPAQAFGDRQSLPQRWQQDRNSVIAAEIDGKLAGTNVVTRWGSFAYFGPLTVRPDLWDVGVGKKLLEQTMEIFQSWGVTHQGLFTFPESPKHLGLYHKFGFCARFLTPVMVKPVNARGGEKNSFTTYSSGSEKEKKNHSKACRDLTNEIYPGLDLSSEIKMVEDQKLGDTLLLYDSSDLQAFAVCNIGPRTEAGSDNCYVKFGAVRIGPDAGIKFSRLLSSCESFASHAGVSKLEAGINLSHSHAYDLMLQRGFRSAFHGVAMHKPNEPGFCREDTFIMDDWR